MGTHELIETLMDLPIFRSEWVLWLLIGLSIISIAIIIERYYFYFKTKIDLSSLRKTLHNHLENNDFDAATALLKQHNVLETNTVLYGLLDFKKGPESVEELMAGALTQEKQRYNKRLNFLAIVASNAPFIGLFGTVLGIIKAFKDLGGNVAEASGSVMTGISEALIATAIGLLVAIPAVVAYNVFKGKVKKASDGAILLSKIVLAKLKSIA